MRNKIKLMLIGSDDSIKSRFSQTPIIFESHNYMKIFEKIVDESPTGIIIFRSANEDYDKFLTVKLYSFFLAAMSQMPRIVIVGYDTSVLSRIESTFCTFFEFNENCFENLNSFPWIP